MMPDQDKGLDLTKQSRMRHGAGSRAAGRDKTLAHMSRVLNLQQSLSDMMIGLLQRGWKQISSKNFCSLNHKPLHVCVVGSGPAGFYTAEKMLKAQERAQVDILDRLPTPFGLVRSGVAPDHPETKARYIVINQFSRVASNERCSFFGNVSLGSDVNLPELRDIYDVVVVAYGAESDRSLGVPGEVDNNTDLMGIHSAREFVWWYNGHPDYHNMTPDLKSTDTAVVLGQGNVALDVARILLRSTSELQKTDIAEHALVSLHESTIRFSAQPIVHLFYINVHLAKSVPNTDFFLFDNGGFVWAFTHFSSLQRKVYLVGRRGPAQMACTAKELREILGVKDLRVHIDEPDLVISPAEEVCMYIYIYISFFLKKRTMRKVELLVAHTETQRRAELLVAVLGVASLMRKTKLLVAVSGVWSILEEEGAASHGHAGGLGVSWRRKVELLAGMSRAQGILYHLACWLVTRPKNADRAGRHETKFEPVEELKSSRIHRRVYDLLCKSATSHQQRDLVAQRELNFKFFRKPFRFLPSEDPLRVGGVCLEKTCLKENGLSGKQVAVGTGEFEELGCGLVLKSIGYKSLPVNGLPFDDYKGVVPNVKGRVLSGNQEEQANLEKGLYVVGWLKRGPTGIIGTNLYCAEETVPRRVVLKLQVASILEDLNNGLIASATTPKPGRKCLLQVLESKNVKYVTFSGWEKIDAKEKFEGELRNKPREKLTAWDELLKVAHHEH
ncbi:hypothetical protein ZIOFF_010059 [Zingiber officinale]|uniref:FAD/NAD(P)-binding domain-containing protein n=1 Tax=Zingiber officinale TaxID=94328 RepID=A0A8J5HLP2_ZINOF|nr:hypothetical protein ZIOFF_010059 [Zingiber officinale]